MSVQSQDVFAAAGVPLTVIGSGGGGTPSENPLFSTIKVAENGLFGSIGTVDAPVSTIEVSVAAVSSLNASTIQSGTGSINSLSVSSLNGFVPGAVSANLVVSTLTAAQTIGIPSATIPFSISTNTALNEIEMATGNPGDSQSLIRMGASTLRLFSNGEITANAGTSLNLNTSGPLNIFGLGTFSISTPTTNINGNSFISTLGNGSFGATAPAPVVSTATQNTIVLAGYRFTWLVVPVNMSADYQAPPAASFFSTSIQLNNTFASPPYTFISLTRDVIPLSTISINYLEANTTGLTNVSTLNLIGSVELGQNIQSLTNFQILAIGPA
jgi:hypothetical protein